MLEHCFLLCLLFALLHSFLDMAPKKSAPLKNPISRCGSLSSSSLPSITARDRCRNSNTQKDFNQNFCGRAIHSKCQTILSDFSDTPLPSAFSSQGWYLFVESLGGVPTCLSRSSTLTYMPSIPLLPGLLWFSKEHIS